MRFSKTVEMRFCAQDMRSSEFGVPINFILEQEAGE